MNAKGGAFGFSRKEIIWFAVIFLTSLSMIIFCASRLLHKYYNHSENTRNTITQYSNDVWNLQEIGIFSVNMQRSSLNLIIYASNKQEIENVKSSILVNKDSLLNKLNLLDKHQSLDSGTIQKIKSAANHYLQCNDVFKKLAIDSLKLKEAADYNISEMRPALRVLSDLSRQTSKSITSSIQTLTQSKFNVFSLYEFWILLLLALPYLYFFYRFLHLFIKVLLWN